MDKLRVLITGAAGFMGSYVVDSLVARGDCEVYGADDLSGGYKSNINPKSYFEKLDLRDKDRTKRFIDKIKPEILYHLAADASEGRSQFTPISATERNLLAYMYTLVPSITQGLKRVVLTSSMSVYGAQVSPFSEDMEPKPEDIYGIAKTAIEESTKVLSKVHGFEYVIIRPHNVYGPRQNMSDPYRNVIGIFINCLLNNKNYYIYGDGNQKRSFTYIDDFNPYFVACGFTEGVVGETINIGPQEEHTINDVSDTILATFFPDGNVPEYLRPKYVPPRPQEVVEAYCTNEKAKKLLGYETTTKLEVGIDKMIAWARAMGPQQFKYLDSGLELESDDVPQTWKKKLI